MYFSWLSSCYFPSLCYLHIASYPYSCQSWNSLSRNFDIVIPRHMHLIWPFHSPPSPCCLLQLRGHQNSITSLDVSLSGLMLASGRCEGLLLLQPLLLTLQQTTTIALPTPTTYESRHYPSLHTSPLPPPLTSTTTANSSLPIMILTATIADCCHNHYSPPCPFWDNTDNIPPPPPNSYLSNTFNTFSSTSTSTRLSEEQQWGSKRVVTTRWLPPADDSRMWGCG